jgi:hypothetical protein
VHWNVAAHPTGEWVVQQLREAFHESTDGQYLIVDRDAKFSAELHQFLGSAGISGIRTSYCSPWQNGVAESWIGSFRNDCSTTSSCVMRPISGAWHGIIFAIITPSGTHDGLDKDTPQGRPPLIRNPGKRLASNPHLGRSPPSLFLGRGCLSNANGVLAICA